MVEREEILASLRETERMFNHSAHLIWERYKPTKDNLRKMCSNGVVGVIVGVIIILFLLPPPRPDEVKLNSFSSIALMTTLVIYFLIMDPGLFPISLRHRLMNEPAELPPNDIENNIKDLQDAYSFFRKMDINSKNNVDHPNSKGTSHHNKEELYHETLKSFQHEVDKELKKSCLLDETLCWTYNPLSEEMQKLYKIDRESLDVIRELYIMLEGKMKEKKVPPNKSDIIEDLIMNLDCHKSKYTDEMIKRKMNPNPAMEVRGLRPIKMHDELIYPRHTKIKSSNIQKQTDFPSTTTTTQNQTSAFLPKKQIKQLTQIAECYLLNNDEIFPKSIDELALYVYAHGHADVEQYGGGLQGWIKGLKIATVKHMLKCAETILDGEYAYWNTYAGFRQLLNKRNPDGPMPPRLRHLP